jgi:hypothetical protein
VQRLAPAPVEDAPAEEAPAEEAPAEEEVLAEAPALVQAEAPAPVLVRARQESEENRAVAKEQLRGKKQAMRARLQADEQQAAQGQGGGQQSDIIKIFGVGPILRNINENRDGKMNSDNPIYIHIEETILRFIKMPVASIIASRNMFYNTMTNKQIISTPTRPKVDMGLGEKMPAPVMSNTTKITPLTPAPQQKGQRWGQVATLRSSASQQKQNGQKQNGQKQYVFATTGGGKRRTHKKCHTKKTRRTQKNHKRKKHGTQRKRSHKGSKSTSQ